MDRVTNSLSQLCAQSLNPTRFPDNKKITNEPKVPTMEYKSRDEEIWSGYSLGFSLSAEELWRLHARQMDILKRLQ